MKKFGKYLTRPTLKSLALSNRTGGLMPRPGLMGLTLGKLDFESSVSSFAYFDPWLNGSTVLDQSPNIGTARPRQPGRALSLNGSDQYIELNNAVSFAGEFTISFWVERTASDALEFVIGNTQLGSTGKLGFSNVANQFFCRVLHDGDSDTVDTGVTTTDFSLYTIRRDASDVVTLVVNDNPAITLFAGSPQSGVSNWGFIGRDSSISNYFDGQISDIRLFDRALKVAEITALYQQGQAPSKVVSGVPNDQVLGYYLDENNFETVYNNGSLGSAYDGSIINGASSMLIESEDVPWSSQNLIGFSEYLHPESTEIYSVDGTVGNAANVRVKFYTPIEITKDTPITSLLYLSTVGSGSDDLIRLGGNTALLTDETIGVLQSGNRTGITTNIPAGVNELEFDWDGGVYNIILNGVSQPLIHTNTNSNPAGLMPADMLELGEDDTDRNLVTYIEVVVKDESDTVLYELSNPTDYIRIVPLKANDSTQDVFGQPAQHTGVVPNNWYLVNSPCLTLDGVDDYIQITGSDGEAYVGKDIRFRATYKSNTTSIILSKGGFNGVTGGWYVSSIGEISKKLNNGNVVSTSFGVDLNDGEWHTMDITFRLNNDRDGAVPTIAIIDGVDVLGNVVIETGTASWWPNGVTQDLTISGRDGGSTGPYFDGNLAQMSLEIINDRVVFDYSFEEDAEDKVYDRGEIGNHGTMFNFSELTSRATKQNFKHDNITNGASVYTHSTNDDLYVPFGLNENPLNISVPAGYTLQGHYPAGIGLNVASAAITGDSVVSPENRGLVLPAEYRKGDGGSANFIVGSSTDLIDSQFRIEN